MRQRISERDSRRSQLPDENVDHCSRELRLTVRAYRSSVQKCPASLTACSITSLPLEHLTLLSQLQNRRSPDRYHLNAYPLLILQAASIPWKYRPNYLLESLRRNIYFPNSS